MNRTIEIFESVSDALEKLAVAADSWGGSWQLTSSSEQQAEGILALPVLAGLRRGWVEGTVTLQAIGSQSDSCRLSFEVTDSSYWLERFSVAMLCLGAAGALTTVVGPLIPALWPFLPIGVLLALAAWLFIVARLKNSGPEEFFDLLVEQTGNEDS